MPEMTWEEINRTEAVREADRAAKKRDLTDRLAKILSKEFNFNELQFLFRLDHEALRTEAYEIARVKVRG
jgi:hypothetical protein